VEEPRGIDAFKLADLVEPVDRFVAHLHRHQVRKVVQLHGHPPPNPPGHARTHCPHSVPPSHCSQTTWFLYYTPSYFRREAISGRVSILLEPLCRFGIYKRPLDWSKYFQLLILSMVYFQIGMYRGF
jgi:hypothetical protein